jgi:hypothetical protein
VKPVFIFDTKGRDNNQAGVNGVLGGFLSTKEFQERLRIEKCRVDRNGVPLSLALFLLKDELTRSTRKLHEFIVSIKKKTREADIRGWINSEVLGLLLFNTDRHGADRCVELLTEDWGHCYCDTITRTYPDPLFHKIEEWPIKVPEFLPIKPPRRAVSQQIIPAMKPFLRLLQ